MTAPVVNTVFVPGTTITHEWLNGVNDYVNEFNPADHSSANVTYDPPFTNSVATTVEDKLAQYVSVKDFGAVGDGVTDDTTAIQNALDSGVELIYGVQGETYLVSGIELPSNVTLDFQGATVTTDSSAVSIFTNTSYSSGSDTDIAIYNAVIDGNKTSTTDVYGIAMQRVSGLTLKNVKISNCGLNGIYIGTTSSDINFENVIVASCGDDGTDSFNAANINVLGGTADYPNSIRVSGVTLTDCESYDAYAHGFIAQFADVVTFNGGKYHDNGRGRLIDPLTYYSNGVSCGQVYGLQINGVAAYDNNESGFDLAAKSINVQVVGCTAFGNTLTGFFGGHGTSRNFTYTGNTATSNGGNGFWFTDTLYNSVMSGNVANSNGLSGFYFDAVATITVSGNNSYGNTEYGFRALNTTSQMQFVGNAAFANTIGDYLIQSTTSNIAGNYNTPSDYLASNTKVARFNRLGSFGDVIDLAKDGTATTQYGHDGAGMYFTDALGGQIWKTGTGTPEGAVTAPVGSMYLRKDGGAGTTLYIKQSGSGNTGWVGK